MQIIHLISDIWNRYAVLISTLLKFSSNFFQPVSFTSWVSVKHSIWYGLWCSIWVFSISVYKIYNSIHHLLVWAIFLDLEMTQGRSCNDTSFWKCLKFQKISIIYCFSKQSKFLSVRHTLRPLYLKLIFENSRNSTFLMKNYSKSIIEYLASPKSRTDCKKTYSWL